MADEDGVADDDRTYAELLEDQAPSKYAENRRAFERLFFDRESENHLRGDIHWDRFAKRLTHYEGKKLPRVTAESIALIGKRPRAWQAPQDPNIVEYCLKHGLTPQKLWGMRTRELHRNRAFDLLIGELWTATFDLERDLAEADFLRRGRTLIGDNAMRSLRRRVPEEVRKLVADLPRHLIDSHRVLLKLFAQPVGSLPHLKDATGRTVTPYIIYRDLLPSLSATKPGNDAAINTPAFRMISLFAVNQESKKLKSATVAASADDDGRRTNNDLRNPEKSAGIFNLQLTTACNVTADLLLWYLDIDLDSDRLRQWFIGTQPE